MFLLTACGSREDVIVENEQSYGTAVQEDALPETVQNDESETQEQPVKEEESSEEETINVSLPVEGEYYYDLTNVVLYLEIYGELPPNYITKKEAQSLGWEGGSVEKYKQGAAIGGDSFGNREGLLPKANGRSYTECDLDTGGGRSRGANRLVFSNDGLYFYTGNHYESFIEVTVTEDYEVKW
ncbi:MAG: ribonuclease [Lachnospiraceae bacterium]|nr:ribonuclease [Lachnospiraceae bacterium]